MSTARTATLTTFAMTAFAANSLLCRAALKSGRIDATSFTVVRLLSAALMLWLILRCRRQPQHSRGNWPSAVALFVYAAAFSYAYIALPAATGALLLFAAVQFSMIAWGIRRGERFTPTQLTGLLLACGGLVVMLLPGLTAPPLAAAVLMLAAGFAWGIYSIQGQQSLNPLADTAANFLRTLPLAVVLGLIMGPQIKLDPTGLAYAIASGSLASGLGYTLWYMALSDLRALSAATIQLSVPLIAALGGIVLLGETLTLRLVLTGAAILSGILLVIQGKKN